MTNLTAKRPRVAFIGLRGIPANYGGFETFAEELAPRLVDRGFDVCVYGRTNNIKYDSPFYKGVQIKLLPTIGHKYLDTVVHTGLSCLHASLFEKFDIILMVNAANAPFLAISRLSRAKLVLNVDGIERLRKKWGKLGRIYYRIGEWLATKLPHEVISDAKMIKEYYQNTYRCDSTLIAYGANTKREEPADTLSQLGVKPDNYVLYVSRLEPENNADKVIQAYQKVDGDQPLVIVGDAPYSDRYKQRLNDLAQQDKRVILAGGIYGSGYRELISNASLYVQATEVGGTHPALIEAMAVGNCVIANDVPEHREALADAGVIYHKNDTDDLALQINKLLNEPTLRADFRERAVARAKTHFSWEAITSQYIDVFNRLREGDSLISKKGVESL